MTTPSTAEDAHLQPALAAEFASLADLLAAAPAARWATPSMCEGWRVREVVAHQKTLHQNEPRSPGATLIRPGHPLLSAR